MFMSSCMETLLHEIRKYTKEDYGAGDIPQGKRMFRLVKPSLRTQVIQRNGCLKLISRVTTLISLDGGVT